MDSWVKCALATGAALSMASPAFAGKDDDVALTELLQVLRQKGVIEDEQYQALALKAEQQEKKRGWTDRISFSGDFRSRYEYFAYFDDPINGNQFFPDRHRLRLRLRLKAKAEVNDYADVFVRLVTGNDSRTTNETLGATVDFDKFDIFLDRAYVKVSPFRNGDIPQSDGSLFLFFGITEQPWRWGVYKDWLLWDDELSPQGFYLDGNVALTDSLGFSANGGLFFIDENSGQNPTAVIPPPSGDDPKMANIQLNPDGDIDERFDVGGRFTWYYLFDLDQAFINRGVDSRFTSSSTFAAGNIPGGLTGNPNGGGLNVVNFGAYAKADLIERWPITLVFDFSRNLDASSSSITYAAVVPPPTIPGFPVALPGGGFGTPAPVGGTFSTGDQCTAWLAGISIGDTKEILRFRMHYAWLEANAFPSQFVDSDLFDQFTNRKGWVWDFSKRVLSNTDASLTMFWSDPIKTNLAYQNSLYGSRRFRMQANMVWSF